MGKLKLKSKHRLLCGDATSEADVERLMDGEKADMAFADPPYNVGYEYNGTNDSKTKKDYEAFCNNYTDNALLFAPFIAITCGKSNENIYRIREDFCEYLTWYKKFGLSRGSFYKAMVTEPILLHGKKPKNKFFKTDCFEYMTDREKGLRELHTCPKPIKLWCALIEPMTTRSDIVLEMFMGSGTTLIACEQLNRQCYGMEIDPLYCDVIVKRWENLTGEKAVRNG